MGKMSRPKRAEIKTLPLCDNFVFPCSDKLKIKDIGLKSDQKAKRKKVKNSLFKPFLLHVTSAHMKKLTTSMSIQ